MQRTWFSTLLLIIVCLPVLLRTAELSLDALRREQVAIVAAYAADVAVVQCDGWDVVSRGSDGVVIIEHAPTRDDFDVVALELLALDINVRLYAYLAAERAYIGYDDLVHRSVPLTAACNMIIWCRERPDLVVRDFENLCTYHRRIYALTGKSEMLMAELSEDLKVLLLRVLPSVNDRKLLEQFSNSLLVSAFIAAMGVDATYACILRMRQHVINVLADLSGARGRADSGARSARSGSVVCPSPAMSPRLGLAGLDSLDKIS